MAILCEMGVAIICNFSVDTAFCNYSLSFLILILCNFRNIENFPVHFLRNGRGSFFANEFSYLNSVGQLSGPFFFAVMLPSAIEEGDDLAPGAGSIGAEGGGGEAIGDALVHSPDDSVMEIVAFRYISEGGAAFSGLDQSAADGAVGGFCRVGIVLRHMLAGGLDGHGFGQAAGGTGADLHAGSTAGGLLGHFPLTPLRVRV